MATAFTLLPCCSQCQCSCLNNNNKNNNDKHNNNNNNNDDDDDNYDNSPPRPLEVQAVRPVPEEHDLARRKILLQYILSMSCHVIMSCHVRSLC